RAISDRARAEARARAPRPQPNRGPGRLRCCDGTLSPGGTARNVPPFLPRPRNQRGIGGRDEAGCPPPSLHAARVPFAAKTPNTHPRVSKIGGTFPVGAIDAEIALRARAAGCLRCGGPLHVGHFERKPRGGRFAAAGEEPEGTYAP